MISDMKTIDSILVRYGEIGIKSDRVRSRYEHTLVKNIEKALSFCEIPYDVVVRDFGRIFVHTQEAAAAKTIARVFGVVSVSPVQTSTATLDAMKDAALRIISPLLSEGKSFGIRARRTGMHDYSSKDVGIVVGGAIEKATGAPVRLTKPDVPLFIEVRAERTYIYTEVIHGVGGLPLGTQGKVIALISGGIDSPVAAWLMMKRGCTIVPLFFDCKPFTDDSGRERALAVVKALAVWAGRPLDLAVVHHGDSLDKFLTLAPRTTCVLCKRMMYRIAASIAKKERAHGIVTGESIGQVASQTTQNLLAIDQASEVPIYRPLICFDKTESIKLARRIGTYPLSTAGHPAICGAAHRHPTTNADLAELKALETQLPLSELTTAASKSLAWQRIFPEKSFRWALCPERKPQ
ncbi:MAG: tRNA uracil 4-sulfurtransferase ThiI [Euryarchaeota archaeon]